MSFFEPPPPPPPPPPAPSLPEWIGPPDNVLPGALAFDVLLARTESVAVYVLGGEAYPAGINVTIGWRARDPQARRHDVMHAWHGHRELTDEVLRLGVQYADGRKATVFDRPPFPFGDDEEPEPPQAVIRPGGGGGGTNGGQYGFWIWPLPREGDLELVVEWPAEGIPVTGAALDGDAIRAAAARAQELWPPPEPRAGAWTRSA